MQSFILTVARNEESTFSWMVDSVVNFSRYFVIGSYWPLSVKLLPVGDTAVSPQRMCCCFWRYFCFEIRLVNCELRMSRQVPLIKHSPLKRNVLYLLKWLGGKGVGRGISCA